MGYKNRVEHDYVTDFIDFHFRNHNLETDIEPYSAVAFGNIEHLCEVISGRGETDPISLLDDLNPTPALCGFPVDQAFGNILSYEMHDRKCYGGMVGLADDDGFAAYVDLRSCLVTPCKMTLIAIISTPVAALPKHPIRSTNGTKRQPRPECFTGL